MPCAIFDYIGAFLRSGFAHVDNVFPVIKTITWLLLPHRNSPEPEPRLRNLHQHAPKLFGTFRNLPELTTSGTYASIHRNPPKSSGTFRELASGTYTILRRNSPEPSATCLRNLHQHTPELSGTFRKPPPEPTSTRRNSPEIPPEPSSGTCSCDPHRHTPELIWAEDHISLRCWGKMPFLPIAPRSTWCARYRRGPPDSSAQADVANLN